MTNKQEFHIEGIISDIAKWLIEERSAYNYDLIISELENGKIVQTEY
jgi:hypothetical protein